MFCFSNSLTVELTGWDYVYVSPCLLLWVVVWLVLTLLQGDGLAPAMLLFALQAGLTVAMFSVFTPHSRDKAQSEHGCDVHSGCVTKIVLALE